MKRRDFLRVTLLGGAVATVFPAALSGKGRGTGKGKPGFTLWQLPSQVDTIGNSYVLQTDGGRLVVMDGGMKDETLFLKGFLAALGNEVEAWFVSHPHNDHMGALTEILKKPGDLKIRKIYHSRFSDSLLSAEHPYDSYAREFYAELDRLPTTIRVRSSGPGTATSLSFSSATRASSAATRCWPDRTATIWTAIICRWPITASRDAAKSSISRSVSAPVCGPRRLGSGTTITGRVSIRTTSKRSTPAAGWTRSA